MGIHARAHFRERIPVIDTHGGANRRLRAQPPDQRIGEGFRGAAAAEVRRGAVFRRERGADRTAQALRIVDLPEVIEHLAGAEQQDEGQ